MIERGTDLSKYPLLESGDEPWSLWSQIDEEPAWLSRAPSIEDSAGLIAAAEEGLGYALATWTLVTRALHKGTLRLRGHGGVAPRPGGFCFWGLEKISRRPQSPPLLRGGMTGGPGAPVTRAPPRERVR